MSTHPEDGKKASVASGKRSEVEDKLDVLDHQMTHQRRVAVALISLMLLVSVVAAVAFVHAIGIDEKSPEDGEHERRIHSLEKITDILFKLMRDGEHERRILDLEEVARILYCYSPQSDPSLCTDLIVRRRQLHWKRHFLSKQDEPIIRMPPELPEEKELAPWEKEL